MYKISLTMLYWILLCVIALSSTRASPFTSKQYRADYVYNKKTDAFYKLHIESQPVWFQDNMCKEEGAQLIVPSSPLDIVQIHSMFKKFPDLGEYVSVSSNGEPHESAEETPMVNLSEEEHHIMFTDRECDVVTRTGEIETYPCFRLVLPFVCKVQAKDAPYNEECDVYSKEYVSKISTTGSCYRIGTMKANWNEAYAMCQADGGHLVILNNEGEYEVVKDLLQKTTRQVEDWQFFAGVRAEKAEPRVFKTVLNQTLEQVGYQPWDANEPNNEFGVEYCVSLLKRTGKYNDTVCRNRYSYVCEKERRL